MKTLCINLGERSYPIYITKDYLKIAHCMEKASLSGKVVVITDTNVDKYQGDLFMDSLRTFTEDLHKYVIPAGENSKNLDTIQSIYKYLVSIKADRKTVLVALGGGVTGDITGFAAATFMRGIPFVQVPTTLLAQADSSVGGKVGVDFEGYKNIIGAFYQPRFVFINVNSLKTLPLKELQAGLAEVIKHGLIKDRDFFEYIERNIDGIFEFDSDVLEYISEINCSIKGKVVEQDEKESGLREILNFGHTFGHAIESAYGFKLLHGECVALGMVAAYRMAFYLGRVNEEMCEKVENVMKKAGLPVRLPGIDIHDVCKRMFYDKKVKNNKITFVLPEDIGKVCRTIIEDMDLIKKVLSELK